jgi:hypothetical protein
MPIGALALGGSGILGAETLREAVAATVGVGETPHRPHTQPPMPLPVPWLWPSPEPLEDRDAGRSARPMLERR